MSALKTIFSKLYKTPKTRLKKHAVKLAAVDDLQKEAEEIYNGMQNSANDALDGAGKLEENLGYLQGYIDRAKDAKELKDEIWDKIADLGIEAPQNLENLDIFIEDILLTDDFSAQNDKLQQIKEYLDKVFFT